MHRTLLTVIPLAAALAAHGGCVVMEVEMSELCVAQPNTHFMPSGIRQATFVRDIDLGALEEFDLDLRFLGGTMVLTEGMTSFAGVESVHVDLRAPGGATGLPSVPLIRMDEPLDDSSEVVVESHTDSNLIGYFESGQVLFDVAVAGRIPERPFTANIDLCFGGQASYETGLR